MFAAELEQCIYATKEPDKYPIKSFSNVIDISPLSIDIVKIDNILYDAVAVSRLFNVITAIRMNWNKFLFLEDEKIRNNIQKNFRNYYENNNGGYLMDSAMADMTSVIDYIMEAAGISEDLFVYFYDSCSIAPGAFEGSLIESDATKIDIEPFELHVVVIDEGGYYASGVNALSYSMRNITDVINADIRKNLSLIINTKTDECIANIDPYLAWFFDDGLSNDWLTSLWRAFKTKAFGYNHAVELNKKYQQHFFPFFEMENDIQACLLRFREKIEDLAFYYALWLDIFQVSPYLIVQTEQTIEGNDFMAPCQTTPDYIRLFTENAGDRFKLSFINVDNITLLNNIRIVINAGSDIAMDAAAGAIGGLIAGPVGVAVGIGVSVVAGLATNAITTKALKVQKLNEYKGLLRGSFEENRRYLISIL